MIKKYIGCSNLKMKDELFSRAGVSFIVTIFAKVWSVAVVICSSEV